MFSIRLAMALALGDLPTPDPPPAAVREKADQIMSDSQFHSGAKSLMKRVLDWISDRFRIPFSEAAGGNTVVGFVILLLCLAGLVYVVSRIRFALPASGGADETKIDIDIERDQVIDTMLRIIDGEFESVLELCEESVDISYLPESEVA